MIVKYNHSRGRSIRRREMQRRGKDTSVSIDTAPSELNVEMPSDVYGERGGLFEANNGDASR